MTAFSKTVTAAVTPERLIAVVAGVKMQPGFRKIVIQVKPANVGVVDVGLAPTGSAASFVPIFRLGVGSTLDHLEISDDLPRVANVSDLWIKVATDGEGVQGFYYEQ